MAEAEDEMRVELEIGPGILADSRLAARIEHGDFQVYAHADPPRLEVGSLAVFTGSWAAAARPGMTAVATFPSPDGADVALVTHKLVFSASGRQSVAPSHKAATATPAAAQEPATQRAARTGE